MPIVIACPSCHAKLKAPDNAVGKNVKCPGCGTALTVRAPAAAAPTAAAPARQPAAKAPARREAPVEDFDPGQEDERPRKPAVKRPPVEEDEDDRPRRGAKSPPAPEEDYEEVEEPRRGAKKRGEPEEDYEEVEEPRRGAKGRADRDEEVDDRPRRGGKNRSDPDDLEEEDHLPRRGAKGRGSDDDLDEIEDEDDRPKRKGRKVEELPQGKTTADERSAAMILWILAIVFSPIGPIVWWIIKKKDMPFVDFQGKQFLNFMITSFAVVLVFFVLFAIGGVLFFVHWIPAVAVLVLSGVALMAYSVMTLVWTILALVKSKNGVWYRIPHTFQFFK